MAILLISGVLSFLLSVLLLPGLFHSSLPCMNESDLNYEELFAGLATGHRVALAVSGGADSMAMMHFFGLWRAQNPLEKHEKDLVLSVDHGLRASSADEVEFVMGQARALGFEAVPLRLDGLQGKTGVQAKARGARYEAMVEELKARGIGRLLTAHTLDDQAETFIMRLRRGSGVEGLAGILRLKQLYGIELVRPLLKFSKQALVAWLRENQVEWYEDPSNQDCDYERVEVRQILQKLDANGELRDQIARSSERLAHARTALEQWANGFIGESVEFYDEGYLKMRGAPFADLPYGVQVVVLQILLARFGQGALALSKIERGAQRLLDMKSEQFVLGGVLIVRRANGGYEFYRETRRFDLEVISLDLKAGAPQSVLWDKRICIAVNSGLACAIIVRALSREEAGVVVGFFKQQQTPLSLDLVLGFATVWGGREKGQLLAVPQLPPIEERLFLDALESKEVEGCSLDVDLKAVWSL